MSFTTGVVAVYTFSPICLEIDILNDVRWYDIHKVFKNGDQLSSPLARCEISLHSTWPPSLIFNQPKFSISIRNLTRGSQWKSKSKRLWDLN